MSRWGYSLRSIRVLHLFVVWTVDVSTGNERFAGTDSKVYIRLLNAQDEETGEYQLTHSNSKFEPGDFPMRNLFEMGSHDRFVIKTEDIGAVVKIHVRDA